MGIKNGFTIIEALLAIVIIGLLAVISIPRIASNDKLIAYNTTRKIVADLRYTRSLAITTAVKHRLVFDPSGGPYTSYKIERWNKVTLIWQQEGDTRQIPAQVTCNGTQEITFEYLGNALSGAAISAGEYSITVNASTGKVNGE